MRIGVDLGGTKIEAVAMAPNGEILARRRVPSPREEYARTIEAIATLVTEVEIEGGGTGSAPVGVGIPGAISPVTGLVKNANSTWLIGHALDRDLADALGRPVRLANDANCFALSEAVDGAACGSDVVFGVILGTGVGAGVVIGARPHDGRNAIAGEWGHNPLPWAEEDERPGRMCYCGQYGCIETFLSGSGLVAAYCAAAGSKARRDADASWVAAAAEGGNRAALDALRLYEHRLARALAHIINVLDPDVIVLGGGLSKIAAIYEAVPRLWSRWVFGGEVATPLVENMHGDSGGVRGAAWLWPKDPEDD